MNVRNLSIKNRFILIGIILSVVLISFSVFMITMIGRLADVTQDIINHPLEVSNAASYANVEVLRMHRDLKDIMLADEVYEVNILVDRIRVSESKVYVALDTISYYILGKDGKDLQVEARVLFNEWKVIRSEIIEKVRNGHQEEAIKIARNQGALHIEALERKLIELNQYARQKADVFQSESIELEKKTEIATIIGIILVFLVITGTILWMSLKILGSIHTLSSSLTDIIESGEFRSVVLEGNDEMVELSYIFNRLTSSLNQQLWIKEGIQLQNNTLVGNQTYEQSINQYVDELCRYGKYLSVAYYHRYGEGLQQDAIANDLGLLKKVYLLNEFVVGECCVKNRDQWLSYVDVATDFPTALPFREMLCRPIGYNKEVFGVLVIVYTQGREASNDEFLKGTASDLATFIATYEQRKKIDQLLTSSISSNEQLTLRQAQLEENTAELEAVNQTLQEQRDLLNVKSSELVKQNNELVLLREELVKKYKDLEEATKYRSQFLTNISHELKTPLNSIIVLSNMLQNKESYDLTQHDLEKIEVIYKAGNALLLTINDILDLARVESGKVELFEEVFDPVSLIQELRVIYDPLIQQKYLKSQFQCLSTTPIYADKGKINHILTNFLSNAIKFTEAGTIHVVLNSNDDVDYPIRIDVKDTGIGIDSEKFQDIFDEFVQMDGSISRLYGGTGLGLTICSNYANLINGKIEVKSDLGSGSTFTLLLPSGCLVEDYVELKTDTIVPKGNMKRFDNKHVLLSNLRRKKVLVCDDEPMNVFALASMLEDIGMVPIATLSGQEAIDALKENPEVDMIFMDYMMPEQDGMQTLKVIRQLEGCEAIPVAIITAANFESAVMMEINQFSYTVIRKPIIYNVIVKLLNETLS